MPKGIYPRKSIPISERLWRKVDRSNPDSCWEWRGGVGSHGYGEIATGTGLPPQVTHRVAWEATYGPLAAGDFVLHKCDNRLCCRPDHLFVGKQIDNMRDAASKKRMASGKKHGSHTKPDRRPRGATHGQRNHIPQSTVDAIRAKYTETGGMISYRELGRQFRVSDESARRYVSGERRASSSLRPD